MITEYVSPAGERVVIPFTPYGFERQLDQACCSVWRGEYMILKIRHDQTSMKIIGIVMGDPIELDDEANVPESQEEFDCLVESYKEVIQ